MKLDIINRQLVEVAHGRVQGTLGPITSFIVEPMNTWVYRKAGKIGNTDRYRLVGRLIEPLNENTYKILFGDEA